MKLRIRQHETWTFLTGTRADFERLAGAKAELPHALLLRGSPRHRQIHICARVGAGASVRGARRDGCSVRQMQRVRLVRGRFAPRLPADRALGADAEGERGGRGRQEEATTISVDQIRALPDFINLSSHRGGPKVIVIHPAETLNVNAANALLKSLEEPPPRTYFLLVTHRPHQLLPTIKSRCRQVALCGPGHGQAQSHGSPHKAVREPELALAHTGDAPLLAVELAGTEYWGTRSSVPAPTYRPGARRLRRG